MKLVLVHLALLCQFFLFFQMLCIVKGSLPEIDGLAFGINLILISYVSQCESFFSVAILIGFEIRVRSDMSIYDHSIFISYDCVDLVRRCRITILLINFARAADAP